MGMLPLIVSTISKDLMILLRRIVPTPIFTTFKKMSKKKIDFRQISRTVKSPVFSTLTFAVIFFLICADSLFSNFSVFPVDLRNDDPSGSPWDFKHKLQLLSSNPAVNATQETVNETEAEPDDPLIPPSNVTREERIAWFRRKLVELEILNSNALSQKFHSRVLEFFNNQCTVQFYMIWLSPARNFGPREFLAMDTLFKTNPHACLILISRSMDTKRGYRKLKPLLDLRFKVLAVTPDLPFLVKNTPAEFWLDEMKSGSKDPGYIPLSINLSNLIRVAMLYKYGGVYLDTDFIVLRDFSTLRNVVGAQSIDEVTQKWTRINGAVLVFDVYHPLLQDFIKEFATTFNGNKWGHNGPYLISRVIERVENRGSDGYNFTVLPPSAFYPVDWIKIRRLFKKPANQAGRRWVEETLVDLTQSYALHLWNKRSRDLIIEEGSVMDRLIEEHCVVCQHINHA